MANQYINKVIYGGETLIDLTGDTVTAAKMLSGITAHDKSGATVTGSISSLATKSYTPTTTDQTITAGQYLSGAQTIKGDTNLVAGNIITGTSIFGVTGTYTADATAAASEILTTKTAYVNGSKVTGSMPNNGAVAGTISTKTGTYTVPLGYHDGSGKVSISSTEQAKIIADNIKNGITILGITGTYTGTGDQKVTTVSVTPYTTSQSIGIPTGYDYISGVTVAAIAYTETDNDQGGKTVTIGTVAP